MPEKKVCPYFDDRFVEVVLPAPLTSRRVATPVCRLAEIMLVRLRATATGEAIADALTMSPGMGAPRSIYGCDLAPPERPSCTLERLDTRCAPSFVAFLRNQSLPDDLPTDPGIVPETEAQ